MRWLGLLLPLSFCIGCASAATPPRAVGSSELVPLHAPVTARLEGQRPIDEELAALAQAVLTEDEAGATNAEAQLRRQGQDGLNALIAADDGSDKARRAIDRVAQQRDARASRLFWYTDLEEAKRVAAERGRPILSLRLLGKLDEDLSCANSRFFRVALYPNRDVSSYLRGAYVLHWSSERPAPKITVDFGDGRKLQRTITGNSIHYVLDEQGRVVDAIPGLYGPKAFMGALQNAEPVARAVASASAASRRAQLEAFHLDRMTTIAKAWEADLRFLGVSAPLPNPPAVSQPTVADANPVAMPKAILEAPMVDAVLPPSPLATSEQLEAMTTDQLWVGIAGRRSFDATLDDASRALMRDKSGVDGATLGRQVTQFQNLMALDTVRNEYMLHRRIHQWMLDGAIEQDMVTFNTRVYRELFLTPRSDPWLGLVSPDAFTGIDNEGLVEN